MESWGAFALAEPGMAEKGRALLYQRGDGEGFLTTVAANGTPRIHPLNVGVKDGRLLVFIQDRSAKARDLESNPHYALHSHQDTATPHEFMVRGQAHLVTDKATRQAAAEDWFFTVSDAYPLYELLIEHVLLGERDRAAEWPPRYRSWRSSRRVRTRPVIELVEITEANRDAVLAVHAGPAEGRFVSSVADSIEEAAETPEGSPWYRAVYLDDEPVGFVMLSWDVTPQPPDIIGPWFLWKLIVDERHQGHGIGRAIVEHVVRLIRAEGATGLFTSHVIGAGGPDGFYERLGFVPTGTFDPQGERILRLDLAPHD